MSNTVTNKDGIEFDIDAIATDLNNKVDLDGTNATSPHVVSRTPNSQGGVVEIWSDGYCVQTGIQTGTLESNYFRITLSQAYKDANIRKYVEVSHNVGDNGYYVVRIINTEENNSFAYYMYYNGSVTTNNPTVEWHTEGYIR